LINIDDILRVCEAATLGPWRTGREDMQSYDGITGEPFASVYADDPNPKMHLGEPLPYVIARVQDESENCKADARFIAASRSDVPALCQRVRELEESLAFRTAEMDRAKAEAGRMEYEVERLLAVVDDLLDAKTADELRVRSGWARKAVQG
jgi:hypothetical protein